MLVNDRFIDGESFRCEKPHLCCHVGKYVTNSGYSPTILSSNPNIKIDLGPLIHEIK